MKIGRPKDLFGALHHFFAKILCKSFFDPYPAVSYDSDLNLLIGEFPALIPGLSSALGTYLGLRDARVVWGLIPGQ